MSDKSNFKHQGSDNTAPYPVSRMAPAVTLTDMAREIEQADQQIQTHASAKLRIIADQIQALQAQAQQVLQQARNDQWLHRAKCNFKRLPGRIYHLYQKPEGDTYFSMLAAHEWGDEPPHTFLGSFRLEYDMSWTPAEQLAQRDDARTIIDKLLE
ncbi:MAG: DUF2452 domain-containing protein [Gammaproteobacteria bacterium]|nr:DUF2452 domain-containing protein [Gammaproteobacteria bacterium]